MPPKSKKVESKKERLQISENSKGIAKRSFAQLTQRALRYRLREEQKTRQKQILPKSSLNSETNSPFKKNMKQSLLTNYFDLHSNQQSISHASTASSVASLEVTACSKSQRVQKTSHSKKESLQQFKNKKVKQVFGILKLKSLKKQRVKCFRLFKEQDLPFKISKQFKKLDRQLVQEVDQDVETDFEVVKANKGKLKSELLSAIKKFEKAEEPMKMVSNLEVDLENVEMKDLQKMQF